MKMQFSFSRQQLHVAQTKTVKPLQVASVKCVKCETLEQCEDQIG